MAPHNYVWVADENGHWLACTGCGAVGSEFVDHTYSNACDAVCDVCAHERVAPHVPGDEYFHDEETHWFACTECGVAVAVTAHEFDEFNECACGYVNYILGDYDGDGRVTSRDAIRMVYYMFYGAEEYPINQPLRDFNGDGEINEDDAIYLLYYSFFGDEYYPIVRAE